MFFEKELLPISALQHVVFCERQWGLIHLEGIWAENVLTAEGRILHERTHEAGVETRGDIRIARELRLRSLTIGLVGQADMVEFHRRAEGEAGAELEDSPGLWLPVPVEYKRGRPKPDSSDLVQLCAQAMCLEEILETGVPQGAIYYGQPRRRLTVEIDDALRSETVHISRRLHQLYKIGRTPAARYEKKCRQCSLYDHCLPKTTGGSRSARDYLASAFSEKDNDEVVS